MKKRWRWGLVAVFVLVGVFCFILGYSTTPFIPSPSDDLSNFSCSDLYAWDRNGNVTFVTCADDPRFDLPRIVHPISHLTQP